MVSVRYLAALASSAALVSALPRQAIQTSRFGCNVQASEGFLRAVKDVALEENARRPYFGEARASNVTIDTYFHVVSASDAVEDGNVPDEQLADQLDVMNTDFAPHGFAFKLVDTTRTVDADWAVDGDETAMKTKLRTGDYKTLNIYFLKKLTGDAFGYAYLPQEVTEGSSDFIIDGVSILATTVPGGSEENFNLGKTVTHEVGHWLGLLHTFEGNSCEGSGDEVSDTPQQESATSGCPTGRDSCPNAPGLDPIHNYMDYSFDACYEEFTKGQSTRMNNMWAKFRA